MFNPISKVAFKRGAEDLVWIVVCCVAVFNIIKGQMIFDERPIRFIQTKRIVLNRVFSNTEAPPAESSHNSWLVQMVLRKLRKEIEILLLRLIERVVQSSKVKKSAIHILNVLPCGFYDCTFKLILTWSKPKRIRLYEFRPIRFFNNFKGFRFLS